MFIFKKWLFNLMIISTTLFPLQALSPITQQLSDNDLRIMKDINYNLNLFDLIKNNQLLYKLLLDDSVLQPVFLIQLDSINAVDEEISDDSVFRKDLLNEIGGKEILKHFSAFSVGNNPDIASQMLKNKCKIIVGVSDRSSQDHFSFPRTNVSNGRSCYFPLSDETLLSVKGIGQLHNSNKPPYYGQNLPSNRGDELTYEIKHWGILIDLFLEHFSSHPTDDLIYLNHNVIAYRYFYRLTDGKGNFITVDDIRQIDLQNELDNTQHSAKDPDFQPLLLFEKVLTPHRFHKLPQIVKADPNLNKTRKRIESLLLQTGQIDHNFKDNEEYFSFMFKKWGTQEARKMNTGYYLRDLHSQDLSLDGNECDSDELLKIPETDHKWDYIEKGFLNKIELIFETLYHLDIFSTSKEKLAVIFIKSYFSAFFDNLTNSSLKEVENYTAYFKSYLMGFRSFNSIKQFRKEILTKNHNQILNELLSFIESFLNQLKPFNSTNHLASKSV